MSDAAPPAAIFDVYEIDDDDASETLIGEADYSADGMLTLTGGQPERAEYLRDVFTRVNAKPMISELVGPPKGAGQFAVSTKSVARGEAEFLDALQGYLMKYYGLRLG